MLNELAAESKNPGALGFDSSSFFAGKAAKDAAVSIPDVTSLLKETSHLDTQVACVVSRLKDQ